MMAEKILCKMVLIIALLFCLCLSGCGTGESGGPSGKQDNMTVGSGTQSGQEEPPQASTSGQYIPEGREVITLGTFWKVEAWSPISRAVNKFNMAQKDYFVQIERCSLERFLLDIVRKQGADIYNLSLGGVNRDIMVEKGIFEDLTPWLENSDAVGREDIVDAVWRAGSRDDKLYFLIPSFHCQGILVEKGHTNEGAWSGKDFLELGRKYPGGRLTENIKGSTSSLMVSHLKCYMDAFVNWEDLTCSFDSDEFVTLLEDMKYFSDYNYEAVDDSATIAELIHNKVYLTGWVNIVMELGMYSYRDIKEAFGDDYEIAGVPTADGSLKYSLTPSQIYGMNALSEHKEGAWAFFEYLLTEYLIEYMQERLGYEFPARKDILERELQGYVDYVHPDTDTGVYYHTNQYSRERMERTPEGFTEEDKQAVLHIIDNSYSASLGNDRIRYILQEETEPFFKGHKTAEEVAKIIQSRVSLYLLE